MAKEYLDGMQFAWVYGDFKQFCDDEFVYKVEFLNAVTNWDTMDTEDFVTAVTKMKAEDVDVLEMGESVRDYTFNEKYEHVDMEFGAIHELMDHRANKTKRSRRDFWATQKWLQKLPVGERVEL